MYHSFLIHLSAQWTSRLLPCPGYYKQCCNEHWGVHVSFNSGFLSVYAQQWNCLVIWKLYFQFFNWNPQCSPEGNGIPLQYSCLENSMDGGAWWAAVHESIRVGHDWATSLSLFTFVHWRRKWQPTPVFLPGESQGRGSLVGCRLWGRTESDTTEAT